LNTLCSNYILWLNSLIRKNGPSAILFCSFFLLVQARFFILLTIFCLMYVSLGLGSDALLAKKERWANVETFLKKRATPEFYSMFSCLNHTIVEELAGRSLAREAAIRLISVIIACLFLDHICTKTSVYDALSYQVSKGSGLSQKECELRLPRKESVLEQFINADK